jgi:uncharacterized protein YfaS (alpha-2-macroglobulin family)
MTQAYRLYVLALAGQQELGAMNRLKENPSLYRVSRWLLAAAYALVGRTDVANDLVSHTQANESSYSPYDYTYGSDTRDWGIHLQTLSLLKKEDEAVKLASRISETLSSNRWLNTQETAYALIGLSAYLSTRQTSETMDFGYTVNGKSKSGTSSKKIWSETLYEKGAASAEVEVKNNSKSTLIVRVISEGTPAQGDETAHANGVNVDVTYEDDKGQALDITRLLQGVNFKAVVTVRNPSSYPLQNLAITNIFPAGWEISNTRFLHENTTEETAEGINYQDIRDDRVYSYINMLESNRAIKFRINLTSVYSGKFYLPPVYCESMYDHLVQANTEGKQVEVVVE